MSKLRDWLWNNPDDPRRPEVNHVLRMAYEALQNRKAIAEKPEENKQIKDAIDIFWGDIPLQYESEPYKPSPPIDEKLAKETGLKKVSSGWLFDPTEFKKKTHQEVDNYIKKLETENASAKGLV